jgi:fatty-acyl-CoA synthase
LPVPLTPIRFLYRAADLYGKKVGIVSGDKQFTYSEFAERCERLASALVAQGVEPGDRVAYLSFNTHQLVEGYYGVVMAGAIVMPLNVRLAPPEVVDILNHSGATLLLFEKDFAPLVEQLRSSCPEIRRFIPLDGGAYEELLASGKPVRRDFITIDENAIAELFYTSGSTGVPKGVMLSHRTVYLHGLSVAFLYNDGDRTVALHTIPLFHANGWGQAHSTALLGAKQVMVRRFEPTTVLRLIQEHKATDMSLVPTMANMLVNSPDISQFDLSSMRRIMIGGAASSPELIARMEKAFHCECTAGYGLTETAPVLTVARQKSTIRPASEEDRYRRLAMAGWPVAGVEMRVVDRRMNDVPRDMQAVGEIVVRGDHVMEGYYKDPQGTAAALSDSWLHTGDMAVWDDEGYIHIVDRKKEIIISGGENISSLEVEKAISAHPEVYECAVVAAPDERWGEVPVAVVYRQPGSPLTAQALIAFLRERIATFKIPRQIEFVDAPLPKTGTGKIRKIELRQKYWSAKEKESQP